MGELSAAAVQLSDVRIHELTREEEAERKRGAQVNLEAAWRELGLGLQQMQKSVARVQKPLAQMIDMLLEMLGKKSQMN